MKKSFTQLFIAVLLFCSIPLSVNAADITGGMEKLILTQGSKQMIHNGKSITASQPLTITKGVTYVAARSFMTEIYGTVVYEAKSKEYVLTVGETELRMTVGKTTYLLNKNSIIYGSSAPYLLNGTLMVPLRTVATNFEIDLLDLPKEKKVELTWGAKPVAKFTVSNANPYAEQTQVTYKDLSYHPGGLGIVDERWENNFDVFDAKGVYTVSHWVQDENGTWSDPYTVKVTVKAPNQPPVAMFSTDKASYKMGELIQYTDLSTDDENRITSRVWDNNKSGFFVPGPQTITLTVTDAHGEVDEYSYTVNIEDETLYTQEQFNLVYTPLGGKFGMSGSGVLDYRTLNYTIIDGQTTLFRSNSPETIENEGIYYEDTVSGDVRFLIHNYNTMKKNVKISIVVTNENTEAANVRLGPAGLGGPHIYVSTAGRAGVANFLEALLNPKYSNVAIPAGESRIIFKEYSDKILKPGDVYSMVGDIRMNMPLKVQVVVTDATRDIIGTVPKLSILPVKGHMRGTFDNANRSIIINQTVGNEPGRLILADNTVDTRLSGIDKTTDTEVLNSGNYGVLYTIRLNFVKPHTAIAINPRGGHYAGAFTVNGKVVYAPQSGILANPNEAGMLYRTGDTEESVTIVFTPAGGSNLPINLLFLPMPVPASSEPVVDPQSGSETGSGAETGAGAQSGSGTETGTSAE
ncbi:stalk domain-containing protein [Cohnella abietis]|uniref:Copper amine oxidase-like N-terminal domain-containing protein n=1 Tax=Cohnella abietis TaxID=2507935 RepID=A0A3T1D6K6_9BACL|nr:stalk domain-containing protein [Cohnella abietis]BBI33716.1 hypothetical protein KCTCHS21_31150 [Cohnella abietis]